MMLPSETGVLSEIFNDYYYFSSTKQLWSKEIAVTGVIHPSL